MRKLKLEELQRDDVESYKSKKKFPISIVLDNIRSAMNVGSFFRSSDAFAVKKIYLCGITAKPPHAEINKTAIGATRSVEWSYHPDIKQLIVELKSEDKYIIGIEQTTESVPLKDFKPNEEREIVLVFGNEVEGLSEIILELLDQCIEIKQYGTKHSLNVSVCGGVVLHHMVSQMQV